MPNTLSSRPSLQRTIRAVAGIVHECVDTPKSAEPGIDGRPNRLSIVQSRVNSRHSCVEPSTGHDFSVTAVNCMAAAIPRARTSASCDQAGMLLSMCCVAISEAFSSNTVLSGGSTVATHLPRLGTQYHSYRVPG